MEWGKLAIALPQLIGTGMQIVEKMKGPKTGAEKEKAVMESIPLAVAGVEGAMDVDFVNDEALQALLQNYIVARVALMNGVENARRLKASPPPSE